MLVPIGEPTVLAENLDAPWSVVRLRSGTTLISERDRERVLAIAPNGERSVLVSVSGAKAQGEGGVLGIAVDPDEHYLYVAATSATDNGVRRYPLLQDEGSVTVGAAEWVLRDLPRGDNHNGGRIAFGPDGMLYVTVGDAGQRNLAQRMDSLGGKILRIEPDGGIPADNPFPGSPVYSLGHRNPQGLAWDADGQLWASEFGQNRWDELNQIVPGGNYGWPEVEGQEAAPDFIEPVRQWRTSEASPSGLAFIDGTWFMAALRGQRVWTISADGAQAQDWFVDLHGRIRHVLPGPDGTLWLLTNNTDGRGSPAAGDDQLIEYRLAPQD